MKGRDILGTVLVKLVRERDEFPEVIFCLYLNNMIIRHIYLNLIQKRHPAVRQPTYRMQR